VSNYRCVANKCNSCSDYNYGFDYSQCPQIELDDIYLVAFGSNTETRMKNIDGYIVVTTIGLFIFASLSLAATKQEAVRDAVIRKCNAVVLKQVPNTGDSNAYQQRRAAVWKDCMVYAGQRP
jgi:hypothetical protein